MAEPSKLDDFKTKVHKLIVKEQSFVDGTLREAGEVVEIVLGRAYDAAKHANFEPFTPEGKKRIDAELEAANAGADTALKPAINKSA